MDQGMLHFHMGAQLTALQGQIQQLIQVVQGVQASLQETRDSQEALGRALGMEWSQDVRQWVSCAKLAALKTSPRDSVSGS